MGGAGNRALKEVGAETDDELPDYDQVDEGYGAGDEDGPSENYAPHYTPLLASAEPDWSFDRINRSVDQTGDVFDDDASSNAPNLAGESLGDRLLEDFGDDLGDVVHHPGMGTPNVAGGMEGMTDDDVVDIRVSPE